LHCTKKALDKDLVPLKENINAIYLASTKLLILLTNENDVKCIVHKYDNKKNTIIANNKRNSFTN